MKPIPWRRIGQQLADLDTLAQIPGPEHAREAARERYARALAEFAALALATARAQQKEEVPVERR